MRKVTTDIQKYHYYALSEHERLMITGFLYLMKMFDPFKFDKESRDFVEKMLKGFGEE